MERNEKIKRLLELPEVGAVMAKLNLVYLFKESQSVRAFFVECLFNERRARYFNKKEFDKFYNFTIKPNNLKHYAKQIEKQFNRKLLVNERIKHSFSVWHMPLNNKLEKNLYIRTSIVFKCLFRVLDRQSKKNLKLKSLDDMKSLLYKHIFADENISFKFFEMFLGSQLLEFKDTGLAGASLEELIIDCKIFEPLFSEVICLILEKEQAIQDKKEYFDFMKKNKKKLNKANAKGEVIEIENGKIKKYQI